VVGKITKNQLKKDNKLHYLIETIILFHIGVLSKKRKYWTIRLKPYLLKRL